MRGVWGWRWRCVWAVEGLGRSRDAEIRGMIDHFRVEGRKGGEEVNCWVQIEDSGRSGDQRVRLEDAFRLLKSPSATTQPKFSFSSYQGRAAIKMEIEVFPNPSKSSYNGIFL